MARLSSMTTTHLVLDQFDEDASIEVGSLTEQEKQELFDVDVASTTSGTTIDASELSFTPAKSFHIDTKGTDILRLRSSSSDPVTNINNPDGSIAYQSFREKRGSSNCVLTDADGHQLIASQYRFGPGKDPTLRCLNIGDGDDAIIKTVSRWTSRSQKFLLHDGRIFGWEYKTEMGFGDDGKKGTALVLNMNGRRLAVLIRNKQARTEGSSSCSAGNGGELVIGAEVGGKGNISEDLVVATVMLMLKKEVDRRRAMQAIMVGVVV